MKILVIAAAVVLSASALQASDFEIKVSNLKNIPVPAPTLAPVAAAPIGSWNTVDASVNKGSQRSTPIENARYRVQGGKLSISGAALKKQVTGDVQNAQISGTVSGVNCTGSASCYGKFHTAGDSLLLDIAIDRDLDGNPEKVVRNVPVGSIALGEAAFSVPVRPVFVEDRYSFAEHLMGLKDMEFVAITVEVSVK